MFGCHEYYKFANRHSSQERLFVYLISAPFVRQERVLPVSKGNLFFGNISKKDAQQQMYLI